MAAVAVTVTVSSAEQMQTFGATLAAVLLPGDVVALNGDLGAGKTCMVQGLARGLGVQTSVTSPSFVLMRQYQGRIPLVHVDVYRLASLSDVDELSDDVFAPDSVTAIEWGEAVRELLGETYLDVEIAITPTSAEPDARTVTIQAYGDAWTVRHEDLQTVCAPFATR